MTSRHALVLSICLAACGPTPETSDASTADAAVCTPDPAVFTSTVRPTVERYCGSCHGETPNFGAPVSLLDPSTLTVTRPNGTRLVDRMAERLADGSMPPVGMPRLPQADANIIAQWASCGATTVPASTGLVSSAPPFLAPEMAPSGLTTIDFHADHYAVGPDVRDDYHCFVFDAPVTEPMFVRRFEMALDQTAVLHHVVLLRDVDHHTSVGDFDCYDGSGMPAGSQYLYAWAPGQSAMEFPSGGLRMSPGERFVVQIHYNNGRSLPNIQDSSGVRMYLGPVEGPEYGMIAIGPTDFSLAPHVRTPVESGCTIAADATVIAGMPHMHLLGTNFAQTITRAGSTTSESLVQLSGWSFGTQLFYSLPTTLHPGDVVHTTCTYMNTHDETVISGENTTDEMCFDFMYMTPPPTSRYCDEGPNDHPTDIRYLAGACLPSGATTDLPLVTGHWMMASAPPALVQASVPDARWVLSGIDFYLTSGATPIGTIDLAASYVLGRGQVITQGGSLTYDVSNDPVVLTDSGVRFGSAGKNSFTGAFDASHSPVTLALTCPAGESAEMDWGIAGDELTIGFTSSDVPSQTLWPRFHFMRAL